MSVDRHRTGNAPAVARVATLLVLALALGSIAHADSPPGIRFSPRVALEGRHPEVLDRAEYQNWRASNPVSGWRETPCIDERQRIVVTGQDENHLLLIEVVDCQRAMRGTVSRIVPMVAIGSDIKAVALQKFREQYPPLAASPEQYAQPDVMFDANGVPTLRWQVIVYDGSRRIQVDFVHGKSRSPRKSDLPKQLRPPSPRTQDATPSDAEDLATNGLHHPDAFCKEARQEDDPKASIASRAQRIYALVRRMYVYNSSIPHVLHFISSDQITRDRYAREGICGEFAVVMVSYLRALGIAAHLVFLTWHEDGNLVSHAAAEFQDENRVWHTVDALNAFDDPGTYARRYGIYHVLATLPSKPDDTRSNTPVDDDPDPSDDGLFNYTFGGDFLFEPGIEGGSRPVYSKPK